jgi:hypothetical protein
VQKDAAGDGYLLFRLRNQSSTSGGCAVKEAERASRNCVYTQTLALSRLFIQGGAERRFHRKLCEQVLVGALSKAADERPSCFLKSASLV